MVDIEHDRLPTTVFNRYLVFEGNFVATAIAIFALGVSKAPNIQQQRWLINVLNATVDTQISWFEQVLAERRISPRIIRTICRACSVFATACCRQPGWATMNRSLP